VTPAHGTARTAIVTLAIVASCSPYARASQGGTGASVAADPPARTAPDTMEQRRGTLVITGSEPMTAVTLQRQDGGALTLLGDLEPELRRLSGATVAVHGTRTAHPPRGGFDVRRYEILLIDGQRPHVGTLVVRDGVASLASGSDTVKLAALPAALRTQSGARVWLLGPVTDRTLHVQSYGIIRARDDSSQ
jgi:hypothetical protein